MTLDKDFDFPNMWAGSALQTNFPFPKWQMTVGGADSPTITDQQIQMREPGTTGEAESRAWDDITEFDPSIPGRVRIHISNITVDNDTNADFYVSLNDLSNSDGPISGDESIAAVVSGNGNVQAFTETGATSSFSTDSTQDNAYASGLNYIELRWDGSTATAETDDGSTTVTVSESGNYPSGSLFLKIAAFDGDASASLNVDFDVDAIEVGTP